MIWVCLIVLALFGTPLFTIIAANALWGYHTTQPAIDLSALAIEFYSLTDNPILPAIPLFTIAGFLLSASQAPARLVRLSNALFGWMPGGLALLAVVTSVFFAAFTGVSGINIIALGALFLPALIQARYSERISIGLLTTSGSIGLLFAPSLPLILYGIVAEEPVDKLFLAGLLPGLMTISLYAVVLIGFGFVRRHHMPLQSWNSHEAWISVRESMWEMPLPVVVLGGIYSGVLTVSDAAVVTLLYVFIVEVVIRREIPWRDILDLTREAMILVGSILMIVGVSLASTNVMIDKEVPQHLLVLLNQWVNSQVSLMLLLLLFFWMLGAVVDIFSAIILVVPLLLPVAQQYGIHPVHLGIIFMAAMELGYSTPPMGLNLFIASHRFERPILQVYWATLPFFVLQLLAVLIIMFWPSLSLWWLP